MRCAVDGSQEPFERVMSCASKIDGASSRAVGVGDAEAARSSRR